MIIDAENEIGSHKYRSNLMIANSKYDALLGTPWHIDVQSSIDYANHRVRVNGDRLPTIDPKQNPPKLEKTTVKKNFSSFSENWETNLWKSLPFSKSPMSTLPTRETPGKMRCRAKNSATILRPYRLCKNSIWLSATTYRVGFHPGGRLTIAINRTLPKKCHANQCFSSHLPSYQQPRNKSPIC